MTSFEFVFGLISVITSLALTRMLSGIVSLYRRADRLRLSWRHALWTATALMVLIGNWSALWGMRTIQAWGVLDVLIPLLYTSVLYGFCDLVMPDEQADSAVVDLREFHAREGRRYKMLQLIFALVVIGVLARSSVNVTDWLAKSLFALAAAVIGTIALRARSVWLDTATAVALSALAVSFMLSRLHVLSTP